MVCRLLHKPDRWESAINAGAPEKTNLPTFTRVYRFTGFELLNYTSWNPQKG
jgi:hypothetical protein